MLALEQRVELSQHVADTCNHFFPINGDSQLSNHVSRSDVFGQNGLVAGGGEALNKITENMDLGSLVSVDGSAAFGIKAAKGSKKQDAPQTDTENEKPKDKELLDCARIINGFYKGKNSINDVAVTLQSDMPIIPICYRTGVLIRNENIEGVDNASVSDIYFSIESYKIKLD